MLLEQLTAFFEVGGWYPPVCWHGYFSHVTRVLPILSIQVQPCWLFGRYPPSSAEFMQRSSNQLGAIATAMLILGIVVELAGITLLIMGKPVLSVTAVLVSGGVLLMLGVIFLAQVRRA